MVGIVREGVGTANVVVAVGNGRESDHESLGHVLVGTFVRVGVTSIKTLDVGLVSLGVHTKVLELEEADHDLVTGLLGNTVLEAEEHIVLHLATSRVGRRGGGEGTARSESEERKNGKDANDELELAVHGVWGEMGKGK